ncbi:hypothetical protein F542_17650 [Bibersteinia trehalosi USDA-ARS-USMARC-188]|uniref:Uncharacterized protein n=2 Tax=Bibersteinia trehalosi TaxID=47735 RepID=A0A4V7IBK3_BIBTR|nr:hypothetical protein [Bibersteinia trehalosi]AGH37720.1 hypothetical protein WQG_4400 [Bibersteinia trehalosi USDA-ARS-USMARC-192]AHG82480.1 hypothetical protein F542_17650 [Bibersteinia trehalosi USDA-ARS-USMARC-188]AHG84802.1 hypothetical protein F543_19410 [Bibersteinia trehalosi USDA-ARS-USMARC-189]
MYNANLTLANAAQLVSAVRTAAAQKVNAVVVQLATAVKKVAKHNLI